MLRFLYPFLRHGPGYSLTKTIHTGMDSRIPAPLTIPVGKVKGWVGGGCMLVEVWYDGCCEPKNPGGTASFGALIKIGGEIVWTCSQIVGSGPKMSNNVAEYSGMIGVLSRLIEMGYEADEVLVRGDNLMTIMQMAGKWRAKRGLYIPFYERCKRLVDRFDRIEFAWIPRELNAEADELSKAVLLKRGIKFKIQREIK